MSFKSKMIESIYHEIYPDYYSWTEQKLDRIIPGNKEERERVKKLIKYHKKRAEMLLKENAMSIRAIDKINTCHIRKTLNLSVSEFARELGVHIMTVYGWESGKRKPSPLAKERIVLLLKSQKREQRHENKSHNPRDGLV